MATNRMRRSRKNLKPIIPKALYFYFETGSQDQSQFEPEDRYNVFLPDFPLGKGQDAADLWLLCRDEVLRNWKKQKKDGLPWAETHFGDKGR